MYTYPQYIYPPTTAPVQRYFANPHLITNKYWTGGDLVNAGKVAANNINDFLSGGIGKTGWGQNGNGFFGIKPLTGGVLSGVTSGINQGLLKLGTGNFDRGVKFGKAFANVGNAIGSVAEKFGPMGQLIGGAAKIFTGAIGGLANRIGGYHLNEKTIGEIKDTTSELNSTRVTDSSNESIANQAAAQNWGSQFSINDVGDWGWAAKGKVDDVYQKLQHGYQSGTNYAVANYDNAATNVSKNNLMNLEMNYGIPGYNSAAYGGFFDNPFNHPGSGAIAYGFEQQNLANQQQMLGQMQAQNQQQPVMSRPFSCGGKIPFCIGGRLMAAGGPTNPHGSDFSNGLIYVDNGGTHEENPYQGVPMGYDQQGTPNVVEQEEVIVPKKLLGGESDYVLSNRIPITPEFAEKYHLPEGISIAQAARKLTEESRENPNDIILEQTNAKLMQELVQLQEQIKAERQQQQMAAQQQALQQLPPEAQQAIMQEAAAQQQAQGADAEQPMPEDAMQMQQPGMAFGGRLFGNGGFFPKVNMFGSGNELRKGYSGPDAWGAITFPWLLKQLESDLSAEGANVQDVLDKYNRLQDLYYKSGLIVPTDENGNTIVSDDVKALQQYFADIGGNSALTQELLDRYFDPDTHGGNTTDHYDMFVPDRVGGGYTTNLRHAGVSHGVTDEQQQQLNNLLSKYGARYYLPDDNYMWRFGMVDQQPTQQAYNPDWKTKLSTHTSDNGITYQENPNKPAHGTVTGSPTVSGGTASDESDMWRPLDTSMRMAPIWASGIATLLDQLGVTNKPDYTAADALQGLANRNSGYMPVSYKPVGERMDYRPYDPYMAMVTQNANLAAARRSIQDNSNGNGALANAGIVAADRNANLASGALALQGRQANDAAYKEMLDYNGRMSALNSQGMLSADAQNATNWRLGQATHASLAAQAIEARQQEKARADAARALNLSNFVNSLSNYGKENMYFNMVMGNPASGGYWYGKDGKWHYTKPPKDEATTTTTQSTPSMATNPYVFSQRFSLMPDTSQYSFLNWTTSPFFNYPRR